MQSDKHHAIYTIPLLCCFILHMQVVPMALIGKTALKCALASMEESAKRMGHASAPKDGQDLIALSQVS